ncbi:MAG: tRNA (adenosine(37)-N6)-threonylcarbamoyltransferase complex ATPase subunit type 1 TsaE [Spirochaetaceae bacterium]
MSIHVSNSTEETREVARRLTHSLRPGAVVALHGILGSGKTTFVKGMAEGLGIEEPVTSPSFALVHEYDARVPLYHIDLYRTETTAEVEMLDLDPYLFGNGITVVEWAERAAQLLPDCTVHVSIEILDTRRRRLRLPDEAPVAGFEENGP